MDAKSQLPPANLTLPEVLAVPVEPQTVVADHQADGGARRKLDASSNDLNDGNIFEVPADVLEIIISDFRPGTDSCRVWLRRPEIRIDHWTCAVGAVLEFQDGAERLTITFQGMNCLPFEDIETVFDCPDAGPQVRPLADPSGGDRANEPAEEFSDAEWRLAAWAETERAVEAFNDPAQFAVTGECILNLPIFTEFDANAECIEVWVPSARDADVPVEVLPTRDGHHGLVMVAGRPTALLQGAPSASARNIRLVPMTSKAA